MSYTQAQPVLPMLAGNWWPTLSKAPADLTEYVQEQ